MAAGSTIFSITKSLISCKNSSGQVLAKRVEMRVDSTSWVISNGSSPSAPLTCRNACRVPISKLFHEGLGRTTDFCVRPSSNKLDRLRFVLEVRGIESIISVDELNDSSDGISHRTIVSTRQIFQSLSKIAVSQSEHIVKREKCAPSSIDEPCIQSRRS